MPAVIDEVNLTIGDKPSVAPGLASDGNRYIDFVELALGVCRFIVPRMTANLSDPVPVMSEAFHKIALDSICYSRIVDEEKKVLLIKLDDAIRSAGKACLGGKDAPAEVQDLSFVTNGIAKEVDARFIITAEPNTLIRKGYSRLDNTEKPAWVEIICRQTIFPRLIEMAAAESQKRSGNPPRPKP